MSSRKKFQLTATTFCSKGRVIAHGENNYKKSHPLMSSLATRVGTPERIFLHAEVQALLRSKDKLVETIIVQRYNSKGEMTLARPCSVCMEALKIYGVSKIKYTTKDGWMEEKLCRI